ncbi:MAG: hypothetical protein WD604_10415 [Balneolaceae bacterium]
MDQKVEYLKIEDLVLWTENPRDPVDESAKDQEIVDKALDDKRAKWSLSKLAKEMGDYYDFSEIPTVVYKKGKPVVYDGNRRIILGKIKYDLVKASGSEKIKIPDFPREIPCNVCVEEIALKNVYRKHADSGSWDPLERDIFVDKFLKQGKSLFLALDEETGMISSNQHLNQGFVKKEILNKENLTRLGFKIDSNHKLTSVHTDNEAEQIFSDIAKKVKKKEISTRKNRGKVLEVLEPTSRIIIDQNKNKNFKSTSVKFTGDAESKKHKKRRSKRVNTKNKELFGGKLYLSIGVVSNIYRDITDLYNFYVSNKKTLSDRFPSLIRMSLRLIAETAADGVETRFDDYLKNNFDSAKKGLDNEIKTTLHSQNITKDSIVPLLHNGAHNYETASNMEQTIALSIILGKILTKTHGQVK